MNHSFSPGDRGFTLVEVLVALLATSMLLAIVLDASVLAKSRLRKADTKQMAVLLAESLVRQNAAKPHQPGLVYGTTNGLSWSVAERLVTVDRRRLSALVEIEAKVGGTASSPLISARLRRLKSLSAQ